MQALALRRFVMPVIEIFQNSEWGQVALFECPGCGENHMLPIGEGTKQPRWKFHGDVEKPIISPSILSRSTVSLTDEQHAAIMRGEKIKPVDVVCHSHVGSHDGSTPGFIQFHNDCTHSLAGKTVPMLPIEENTNV